MLTVRYVNSDLKKRPSFKLNDPRNPKPQDQQLHTSGLVKKIPLDCVSKKFSKEPGERPACKPTSLCAIYPLLAVNKLILSEANGGLK